MSLLTYAKAAAPLLPGAGKLPFLPGGGGEMPRLERSREDVSIDREHLTEYARVCGFSLRDELPATYPHVLAFPLHMQLITDGSFPFTPVGLVHLANSITVHRTLRADESFDVHASTSEVRPHPKGRTFDLVTEVRADGEVVWQETSTTLRRGRASTERSEEGAWPLGEPPAATVEWRLPGDLGRRYAAVSGDSNPIHMNGLAARAFGFPRAIAHGMWTKARCLAALEGRLPDSYTVEVRFMKPIFLSSTVGFGTDGERFVVRTGELIHLEGAVKP